MESHNRRLRVKDFFTPFDGIGSGYVSQEQAKRGLALTKLSVTEREISLLLDNYSVRKTNFGGLEFDYKRFCEPFTDTDLEKEPRRTARNPNSQLLHLDLVRGVAPPPRFIGVTDPEAPQVEPLPGNTTQRWAGAKDPGAKKPKPARNPASKEHPTCLSASAPVAKLGADEKQQFIKIMTRLRAVVKQRGLVIKDIFRVFDRSHNGFVTKTQFRQALPPELQLNDEEAKIIQQKYTKGQFLDVDYLALHEALESDEVPLFAPDIASHLEPLTVGSRSIAACELPQEMRVKAPREEVTQALLDRLNHDVFAKNVRIRDFFKHHDGFVTGYILPDRFQQGIIEAGLELTELEFLLICTEFRRATDGKINYHEFCKRMERLLTDVPADGVPMMTAAGKTSTLAFVRKPELPVGTDEKTGKLQLRMSKSGLAIAQLLLKIQNRVAKNRIRVLEFFRDFDKLRKGFVTRDKFITALTQMGLELQPPEIAMLLERFVLEGTEKSTKDMDYVEFAEWLDLAFTRPNLEQHPLAPAPEWDLNEEDPIYMTEEEADKLDALLSRIAQQVAIRGVIPKTPFASVDKVNTGLVTQTQAASAFQFLNIKLSDDEQRLLFLRFKDSHADKRNDFRYNEFCRVINKEADEFLARK